MVCKIFLCSEFTDISEMFRRRKRKKGRLKVLYFTNKRNSSNAFNTDVEDAFGQTCFIVLTSSLKTALHGGSSTGKL